MKPIFLIFCTLVFLCSHAQENTPTTADILSGIAAYRDEVLSRRNFYILQLRRIADHIGQTDLSEKRKMELETYLGDAIFWSELYNHEKKLKEIIGGELLDTVLLNKVLEIEAKIIFYNYSLFDLAASGIIEKNYPHNLSSGSTLLDEFQFYQLQNGQRIGELGAGHGVIGIVIGAAFRDMEIFINEISPDKIAYIRERLDACQAVNPGNIVHLKLGNKERTHLEGLDIDKVIMRNAFHHFSRKDEMLASIRRSLSANGRVFLLEGVRDLELSEFYCGRAMHSRRIKRIFEKQGFRFVREKEIDSALLMEFVVDE